MMKDDNEMKEVGVDVQIGYIETRGSKGEIFVVSKSGYDYIEQLKS